MTEAESLMYLGMGSSTTCTHHATHSSSAHAGRYEPARWMNEPSRVSLGGKGGKWTLAGQQGGGAAPLPTSHTPHAQGRGVWAARAAT